MTARTANDDLLESAQRFEFFQAVRLLSLARPGLQPVGQNAAPIPEVVRFRAWLSLAFPPSAIRGLEAGDDESQALMTVTFMGLCGPEGALPSHYTERLIELEGEKDHALRDFLGIFEHRMISLFFRAHEKYRFASSFSAELDDPISHALRSWLGSLDSADERTDTTAASKRRLLRYVGLFSRRPRSAAALETLLRDYFKGVSVRVEQFVGSWVTLAPADRGRLDDVQATNRLGRTVVIGERMRDAQGRFRVRLGPLDMQEYLAYQPEGEHFDTLCALVHEFAGDHLGFDVQPVLRAADVPRLRLERGPRPRARLGRTSWLSTNRPLRDAADVAFRAPDPTGRTAAGGNRA